jgi:hypothetical protein
MQTNKIDIRDQYNKRLNKAREMIRDMFNDMNEDKITELAYAILLSIDTNKTKH